MADVVADSCKADDALLASAQRAKEVEASSVSTAFQLAKLTSSCGIRRACTSGSSSPKTCAHDMLKLSQSLKR